MTRKKRTTMDMEHSRGGNLFDRAVGVHKKNISRKESLAIALVIPKDFFSTSS